MNPWQPTLNGSLISLRPMTGEDFEELFLAASDPLIWEQHPDSKRYTKERFQMYFDSGMESKGALVLIDPKSHQIIGSSRFTDHHSETSSIEIGFTFLTRKYWGGEYNRELKSLMLNHAFRFVETVYFIVGKDNLRSQHAMTKIVGIKLTENMALPLSRNLSDSVVFEIKKTNRE